MRGMLLRRHDGQNTSAFQKCAAVQPSRKNICLSETGRSVVMIEPVPRSHRGRFAIVTKRGRGMRGRGRAARRAAGARTVKPCGPDPPTLGSSLPMMSGRRRGLTSPVPRGERGEAVKPLRRECRMSSALPVYLVCTLPLSAHKLAGAAEHRHLPAFPFFGGRHLRDCASTPRECEVATVTGCFRQVEREPRQELHEDLLASGWRNCGMPRSRTMADRAENLDEGRSRRGQRSRQGLLEFRSRGRAAHDLIAKGSCHRERSKPASRAWMASNGNLRASLFITIWIRLGRPAQTAMLPICMSRAPSPDAGHPRIWMSRAMPAATCEKRNPSPMQRKSRWWPCCDWARSSNTSRAAMPVVATTGTVSGKLFRQHDMASSRFNRPAPASADLGSATLLKVSFLTTSAAGPLSVRRRSIIRSTDFRHSCRPASSTSYGISINSSCPKVMRPGLDAAVRPGAARSCRLLRTFRRATR